MPLRGQIASSDVIPHHNALLAQDVLVRIAGADEFFATIGEGEIQSELSSTAVVPVPQMP